MSKKSGITVKTSRPTKPVAPMMAIFITLFQSYFIEYKRQKYGIFIEYARWFNKLSFFAAKQRLKENHPRQRHINGFEQGLQKQKSLFMETLHSFFGYDEL
jgi:hypothetical protein